ncbi:MAG: hypothetical protein CMM02_08075 [Rhodopirellula sp.]|mgnify:CR=1 FL=1|nr:hypothetical protein [Rhodopirellula sp.]MAT10951.1 hypothetical protein [Rhodopirellula sp.]|tara:strand:+ start:1356 stop:1757 length:402 start_codon:yes stop_codon:yes gene_type:complete
MADIVGLGKDTPELFMPLNLPKTVVSALKESACKTPPEWKQFLRIARSRGVAAPEAVVERAWMDLRRDGLAGASVEEAVDYLLSLERPSFGALHDAPASVDAPWGDSGGSNAVQTGLDRPVKTTTTQWEKAMD